MYAYLKPDVKKTVDNIFAQLAHNASIQKMYKLWCEMEQQKHDLYSSAKVTFPLLVDNQQFKSVKNMIIKTVLEMDTPPTEDNAPTPPEPPDKDDEPQPNSFTQKRNDDYDNVKHDINKETEMPTQPADDCENAMFANTVMNLLANIARIIEDDYMRSQRNIQSKADKKLRNIIEQKNKTSESRPTTLSTTIINENDEPNINLTHGTECSIVGFIFAKSKTS